MTRETSTSAYDQIKADGLLPARQLEVYEALRARGPATAMEVFDQMVSQRGSKVAANVYARLSELRERGVVVETGIVRCSKTGMRVIQWQVTEGLPTKLEKKARVICPHCGGRGPA